MTINQDRAGNVDVDVPINGAPYSPTSAPPPGSPFIGPTGYDPGYYSQYPPPPPHGKPGDPPPYYPHTQPQYYFTTVSYSPPPSPHAETTDVNAYPPAQSPYRAAFVPPYHNPSYVMSLPDASVSMGGHQLYQMPQS